MRASGFLGLVGVYFAGWMLLQRSKANFHANDVADPPKRAVTDMHRLAIAKEEGGRPERILNIVNFGVKELDVRTCICGFDH